MGKTKKKDPPTQENRRSKRLKALPIVQEVSQDGATCKVYLPAEFKWITAGLSQDDPLLAFDFNNSALNALVTELQRVQAVAPAVPLPAFTTYPFVADSVKGDILNFLADITTTTAGHSQVQGCLIGPNTGVEYGRVMLRISTLDSHLWNDLNLLAANLQFPLARAYVIFEGRPSVPLVGTRIGNNNNLIG